MTELDLYKYIKDNSIDWHRHEHDGGSDVVIFISPNQIEAFSKMIGDRIDECIECFLKGNYCCIWMRDICERFDIDIDRVFTGEQIIG